MRASDSEQRLPVFASLRGYRPSWIRSDVSAGLAIAAVGLPSAIAYPAIAGLPPETGLYASIAPLIAYAVFGPSRQLIVGPDAATMTVLAAVLATIFSTPGVTASRVAVAALLAIAVGALCLIARALRLGVVATFLSRPILTGFFAGISLSIILGQIGRLTGVKLEAGGLLGILEVIDKAGLIHWPSLALGLAMLLVLQAIRVRKLPVPGPVIVVVLAAVLSAVLDLEARGIALVGDIPAGLPKLALPAYSGVPFDVIVLGATAIFLVSYGSGIVTASSFADRGGDEVDPNRELTGFGAANIAAGFYGSFPVSASDSRTAVNLTVGGRSQIAAIVAAAALMAALLFLGPALRILPIPALGAILVAAALSLIDFGELRQIMRISRAEFLFALIALAGPLSFGVLQGVVIAVGATLVYVLYKSAHPRDAMLGRIPGRDGFYKLHRSPEARPVPGLALCIIEGSLLFFNCDNVKARLRAIASELPPGTEWFVLNASAIAQVDSTGAAMLARMAEEFAARGLALGLAEVHSEALGLLERAGVVDLIGATMVFDDLDDAMRAFRARECFLSVTEPS
ncbi:SulP family inorganic anion transporter [Ensifer sp. LCM 4579]|uniref:SulP family inorganic anion transporter n=1 Tax=Ensifer sp. LCM 4579 TaxID=1848292 RepID=UPI0008DACAE2|nr:SulP family inorganic anion transporter [Ensifer sp. LCM 4579]OHV81285.1 sulfate transporter [Ensifer sp. LCM 4579]